MKKTKAGLDLFGGYIKSKPESTQNETEQTIAKDRSRV